MASSAKPSQNPRITPGFGSRANAINQTDHTGSLKNCSANGGFAIASVFRFIVSLCKQSETHPVEQQNKARLTREEPVPHITPHYEVPGTRPNKGQRIPLSLPKNLRIRTYR
jgi:hypothetical protein